MINSTDARAEENFFNLIATPGYTECLTEMVALNTDKNNVAFVVADTPWKLPATGTSFVNWANNAANAAMDGPDALITHSPYAAVYYPWGLTPNLSGVEVVVPPSLIALRTIAYNDQVAYPWFAPAGFNRGLVTGVSSVGYLDSAGDYIPVKLGQGQRDVLYQNSINPIAYIPGRGLVVYGQKTLDPVTSALDRINVSRLINYLVYNLENLAKPFLFEPNDKITRSNVVTTFNGYLQNLVSLRALYDFAVVCDTSNNTPTRIDQNQLWIDIAIKPEKAIEFIYIPIRVLNTGAPLPGGRAA
jgi:phage tail sheath protein FI